MLDVEVTLLGVDVGALLEIVTRAAGEIRQRRLRRLRIEEHVRLVGALSTAGQPSSVSQIGFPSGAQSVGDPASTPPGRS